MKENKKILKKKIIMVFTKILNSTTVWMDVSLNHSINLLE